MAVLGQDGGSDCGDVGLHTLPVQAEHVVWGQHDGHSLHCRRIIRGPE
jgi:hypothetical protein